MFAVLGNITFEVITSPESMDSEQEFKYAREEIAQGAPTLQWLANDLQKITLAMMFHEAFCDPAAQLQALRDAATAHQAMALVFGNGTHRGYFVITKLGESPVHQYADGTIVAIRVTAELTSWTFEHDPSAPAKPTSPPIGVEHVTFSVPPGSLKPGQVVHGMVSFAPAAGVSALINNAAPTTSSGVVNPDDIPVDAITGRDTSVPLLD